MLSRLRRLLRPSRPAARPAHRQARPAAPARHDWPAPAPEGPVCIVGDVHGCAAMLDELLDRLADEAEGRARIVLVGDLVDRGPDSAAALRRARGLAPRPGGAHEVLLGNHEEMMLDFLDDPAGKGLRWLRFGGRETMESFGIAAPEEGGDLDEIAEASDALREALGPLEAWVRALPLLWHSGNLAVTHAGADPARPIGSRPRTLVWGHSDFMEAERADGIWVAHGHTVVEEAYAEAGRIGVDTGAVYGGPLTAAVIEPGRMPRFVSVG